MGKSLYADIVKKLPTEFGVEPAQQEKVNGVKEQLLRGIQAGAELSDDALEDICLEAEALLKVINDALLAPVSGRLRADYLAKRYRQVRRVEKIFDQVEKINNVIKEAFKQILVDCYETEDISSVKFLDGGSVGVQKEPHAKLVDPEKNRQWAIDTNRESLLRLQWNTLNALTKEALVAGENPPDGVEATCRPKVVFREG